MHPIATDPQTFLAVNPIGAATALFLLRRSALSTVFGAVLLGGCGGGPTEGSGLESPEILEPGDHEFALTFDSRSRYFLVHVPSQAMAGEPLPVVVALHGGGGNPEQFKSENGVDEVADAAGFIAVYPAGTGVLPRTLLTWNAGTDCCGFALEQDVDDVGFLMAVVDDLDSRTEVDSRRVYFTGHSNGGIMAYRIAAEAAERVAAIAPVAGAMMQDEFSPNRAVPLLHIHSVDDPRALYEGGLGPPFPIGGGQVLHQPAMDGILAWVARNGCAVQPQIGEEREGGSGTPNEGHRAERLTWDPCETGAPVIHWRLHGVGHGWPGVLLSPAREELVGTSTTLLSAAAEAWMFFENHALP